jgi:uncharacterized OB-fold protein
MRIAAHPGLYRPDSMTPLLSGSSCARCGQVSFPPMPIGCEACGATEDQLERAILEPSGVVHSIATVHLHHGEPPAPFAIAEIQLDGGPLIRATLSDEGQDLAIGDQVTAVWAVTSVNDEGDETVEPRFTGVTS